MKRVVLERPGRLLVKTEEDPLPEHGEALIRVRACGICGSDVHAYLGNHPFVKYPVTPGHEFTGEVIEVGPDVDTELLGSRVCVEPSLYCGECPRCASGRYNICDNLRVLGFQAPGAMCDKIAVPSHRIHFLPDSVTFTSGTLTEPAAVGVHALSRAGADPGDSILVIGAGVIGLMLTAAAKDRGCSVVVVEETPRRAARARDFGADESILFNSDPEHVTRQPAAREDFKAVFECVGKSETMDLSVRLAPRGSTVVIVGVFPGPVPVRVSLVQDGELDLRGSLMYTGEDFEKAIRLIEKGAIEPGELITHTVDLDEAESGYKLVLDPETPTLKVLVKP